MKQTIPFIVLAITMLILITGCATAEPMHSPVPAELEPTVDCSKLVGAGKAINEAAVEQVSENLQLAAAMKQVALSYYSVYAIECLEKESESYKTIQDYVITQQNNLYELRVEQSEANECRNGLGM